MSETIGPKRLEKLPDELWIEAEHPETGERYGMQVSTFKETYQGKGYKITGRGDGQPLLEGNEINTAETQVPASQQKINAPIENEESSDAGDDSES